MNNYTEIKSINQTNFNERGTLFVNINTRNNTVFTKLQTIKKFIHIAKNLIFRLVVKLKI